MSLDLGDLSGLATALGLVDGDDLVPDWFARPGDHLATVLSNPDQRAALVAVVDELLGGEQASTDALGRQWLPLVTVEDGRFSAYAVLDADASRVQIAAGARLSVTSSAGVGCHLEVVVPLFAQAVSTGTGTVVAATTGAYADLSLTLTLPDHADAAGTALAAAVLDVAVPTWTGGEPRFGLTLQGLRMPGASAATDVSVTAETLGELNDALVALVLGLVQAQVTALATTEPLRGLAAVLGLTSDGVPAFPLDDLAQRGVAALLDWLAAALTDDTARSAWLEGLATLIGGSVVGVGAAAQVELDLSPAALRLGLITAPGATALPTITPSLLFDVAGATGVRLALDVEPVRLDLGTVTALALPRLSLTARITSANGAALLTPSGSGLDRIGLGELRIGFGLDPARRPMLLVEARNADIGETHFDVLDLTSPDALAAAAGQVVSDAAASLLDGLGAAGDTIGLVLGIPRAGNPDLPAVDTALLLSDPLGAVADRWLRVLTTAASEVPTVLEALRDLIADTAGPALPVSGGGTEPDPWRVPVTAGVELCAWFAGDLLTLAVEARTGPGDLAASGFALSLDVTAVLVELRLGAGALPRQAAFLPRATGRLVFTGAGGGPIAVGSPPTSLTADELGLAASWSALTGARVQPISTGARLLRSDGSALDLPIPVIGPDGRLALDDAGWAALEALAGAVAEALLITDPYVVDGGGLAWITEAVRMVGWSPISGSGPAQAPSGPRLSLAGLVTDPAGELEAYLRAVLDVGSDVSSLNGMLDLVTRLLGGLAGRVGSGAARDPWRLPLLGTTLDALGDAVPALLAWLGPGGPDPSAHPEAAPLYGWQAGDTPLPSATLVSGLIARSAQDDVLADLVAGRGDLVTGLEELVVRWAGTDGLVGLIDSSLPAGVTGHRLSDVDHTTPLAALDLSGVVGAVPAIVVHVAVDAAVLPQVSAHHSVDLTAAGLPAEAFTLTLPADTQGNWTIHLGGRVACRATGAGASDPDGVLGQAGRLAAVLRPLAGLGGVLVVAHGGAGQPAVRAAADLAAAGLGGIEAVVTVGTPWTTLSVDTLDRLPGADALRLLTALLPAAPTADGEEEDDEDLAAARRILGVWQTLDTLGDPLADLRPPAAVTPVAGVTVHACVGALGEETVRRAITATVVTGLVQRAWERAETPSATPELTRFGVRWPILAPTARAGLVTALTLDLDLAGASGAPDAAGPAGPAVVIRLALGGAAGTWLLGGPDPGRTPGTDRPLGLRRLTARVVLPLDGAPATARVDLHDALTLGVRRSRWTLAAGPSAPADATPALPEVRALLGATIERLTTAAGADPVPAALLDALISLGLVSDDGGLDAVTLDRLLLDPAGVAATVIADQVRRSALASALRGLAGDLRDLATAGESTRWTLSSGIVTTVDAEATVDLATRTVTVTAAGSGAIGWSISGAIAAGLPNLSVRLGPDLPAPPGVGSAFPAMALLIDLTPVAESPLTARLRVARAGGSTGAVEDVPLWPAPDADAIGRALADLAPPTLARVLLDVLRPALADAAPAAAQAVDTLLDALGLLCPAAAIDPTLPVDETPLRRLRLPVGLLTDPSAWLRSLPAAGGQTGLAAVLPAVLDAVRDLIGAGGGPGRLELAAGIAVTATNDAGTLRLAVAVDTAAFAGAGAADRLVLSGRLGLTIGTGDSASARPDLAVTGTLVGVGGVGLTVSGGTGAVTVGLDLLPDGGVAIPILPAGPGLGAAVAAAAVGTAVRALPHLLDEVAALDPAGAPSTPQELAGRLVARLGDALALRAGTPATFGADALSTFGADPAGALAARSSALASSGLDLLVQGLDPVLGAAAGRSVSASGGALVLTLGPASGQVELRWTPGTNVLQLTVRGTGLPGVEELLAVTELDATGLAALDLGIGPAQLDAGVVMLRPFARVLAGRAPAGGRAVELGLDVGADQRLIGRWNLAAPQQAGFTLLTRTGDTSPVESTTAADVTLAVVAAVLDLAGAFVLAVPEVAGALDAPLLGTTVRDLLAGVLLDESDTSRLDTGLLDVDELLPRLGTLLSHLATAPGAEVVMDDALTLRAHAEPVTGATRYGLTLGLARPFDLGGTDVTASLEQLSSWIDAPGGPVPGGLTLDLLTVRANGTATVEPALVVGGVGLRLGRTSGPLLDAGITIDEVAVHLYADVARAGTGSGVAASGGARLELGGLTVGLAGASGGDNAVANGMLGSGSESPKPRFSPAIAVQKHGDGEVQISLSAGDGFGPWWVVVQKGFGPIYVEQVGLLVTMSQSTLGSVGLLIDGQVSLLGLTASVDDLSLTYLISTDPPRSPLSPEAWAVDLAGLAVTADVGGIALAGGLRKFPAVGGGSEYLGLLMARFAVYGISVYGGYGLVGPEGDQYASLFLFGAVNGPIGGPPAFFVTGIGGGFGINRALTYPSDLSQFGTYPFIKALDPAARPGDPMAELESVRQFFPAERGSFWFAAGLSFTSFALVDGVAVIAVQIGDGFELALLGLARMALPRPEAAIVSVELGLLARVSTSEGLILVQAQLTDNSWLLFPTIRLTGGFAFASWFGGANQGQFVLTLGGYHPSFHRDGYPVVPRLGIAVDLYGFISITGESYFALTSEALMAGVKLEVSADLGPAWAHLVIGCDGIVYFDPFWLEVTVYASISAGVTIDVWIGEITISVSLRARVTVTGPPFHARATFSVGPVDLEVEFGDTGSEPDAIDWATFIDKYLETAGTGTAAILTAVTGKGGVPPAGDAATGGARSPDGSDANPFRVVPEFELTVTSTAPLRELSVGGTTSNLSTVPEVSAAPMRAAAKPRVALTFVGPEHDGPVDRADKLTVDALKQGWFAIGTWGPAQDLDDKLVPAGDVLNAVDRLVIRTTVAIAPATGDIEYRQVEIDPFRRRRPLPFLTEGAPRRRAELGVAADRLADTIPPLGSRTTLEVAAELLTTRAGRSVADVAAWTGSRAAPPLLGSLGEGLGRAPRNATITAVAPEPPKALPLRGPQVSAVLAASVPEVLAEQVLVGRDGRAQGRPSVLAAHTTVGPELLERLDGVVRSVPPRTADVDARMIPAVPARLIRGIPVAGTIRAAGPGPGRAAGDRLTVLPTRAVPATRSGRSGSEAVAGRGATPETLARLRAATDRLDKGMRVPAGEVHVLSLPDADRDVHPSRRPRLVVRDGVVRVVLIGPGGRIDADTTLTGGSSLAVPPGTRRMALVGLGRVDGPAPVGLDVAGWANNAALPYLGGEVFLGAGAVIASGGRVPSRRDAQVRVGWVAADLVVGGASAVVTRFAEPADLIAVALEGGTGDDVALGIEGARRVVGTDGSPEPPLLVADGPRAVAVFRVLAEGLAEPRDTPEPDRQDAGPLVVTVSTGSARRLVGVAAARGVSPAVFGEAIAVQGFPTVVTDPVPAVTGDAVVVWKGP